MVRSEPLCLSPIYRARAVYEHLDFFIFQHTQNRQLGEREERFAEFDKKKCVGLELLTAPLILQSAYTP